MKTAPGINVSEATSKLEANTILLRAASLTKTYQRRPDAVEVLKDLSFEVVRGEMVAIVGESGTGKSTLLHLLGGLDRPTSGSVILGEFDMVCAREIDLSRFRNRNIGFVFQFHHLLPEFSALENVMMPQLIAGRGPSEARTLAAHWLERVGLKERGTHRPGELSGGEQQRVAIARALVGSPQLLLADEPTGNLDPRTGQKIANLIRQLQREEHLTAVIVSHNERLAVACDRIFRLDGGRLIETRE